MKIATNDSAFGRWLAEEDAQGLSEYGLIGAIVAIGAIGILSSMGTDIGTFLGDVARIITETVGRLLD